MLTPVLGSDERMLAGDERKARHIVLHSTCTKSTRLSSGVLACACET